MKGIAEHEDRFAEREQIAPQFAIDHRALVDHDQAGAGRRAVLVERECRRTLRAFAGTIDQRMDRRRAGAALGAHDERRLSREGGENRLALRALGDMSSQCRLADAGIAEQPEHLRLACP